MPVTEPIARKTVGWTPQKIKSAEQQADMGKLLMAADLCEAMFGDDRYSGVMQTLSNVISLPLSFIPGSDSADADTDPACLALGGARGDWWHMLPETTLAEIIPWLRTLGLALLHQPEWVENEDTGRIVANVEIWSPRWLELKDGQWIVETSEGKKTIEPGDGEWQIWTSYRKTRPWGIAPWRGLSRWWLAKAYAILDEMDISDKQGDVLRVAQQMGIEHGITDPQRKQMVRDIKALGRKGVYAPPPGIDLKQLETAGKGADICARIIEQANMAFAVTHLGGNLSAEVTGGSFAAASVHSQITADRIRSVAELISTESRDQLLSRWHEFNFGGINAPWPIYDTTPPADRTAQANQISTISTAVSVLAGLGISIDLNELVDRFNLPIVIDTVGTPNGILVPDPSKSLLAMLDVMAKMETRGCIVDQQMVDLLAKQFNVAVVPQLAAAEKKRVPIDLAPTDVATVVRVSEARVSRGLESLGDERDNMLLSELKASQAPVQEVATPVENTEAFQARREAIRIAAAAVASDRLNETESIVDGLETQANIELLKSTRPKLDQLVALVKESGLEDAPDLDTRIAVLRALREKVIELYGDFDPADFADVNERLEMLAAMTGAYSSTSEAG